MSRSRCARWVITVVASTLFALCVWAARQTPPTPVATGNFAGTWTRQQPKWKQVVMLRKAASGHWELSFRWDIDGGVSLDTAFHQRAEFVYDGFPGFIELEFDPSRSNDSVLVFHYKREQKARRGAQLDETGDVQLYRSYDGRQLVWLQDPMRVHVTIAEPLTPDEEQGSDREEQRLWIFQKRANRELLPDEITW
ncbi:MAG: hypothetical protein U0V87_07340 [Acidobacteriota bacterium]